MSITRTKTLDNSEVLQYLLSRRFICSIKVDTLCNLVDNSGTEP